MRNTLGTASVIDDRARTASNLAMLRALEQKVLWLAVWMIHHANHIRPNVDGLKVGGHQASSASMVTLMTALYFDVLRPEDRVAVKPHASPVFHAIQYLFGRQSREKLERFRAFGGAQSYPSRTKDTDDVDFSTGSVGLGVAMASFAALVQEYLRLKKLVDPGTPNGRMVALLGDAEFDEGNVFEALLESWKQDIRDVWWIIDYNRQSLDALVVDRLCQRMGAVFQDMEWRVITLKYGRLLEQAFAGRGGDALRDWIDQCPNAHYSDLAHSGGAAWRARLLVDLGTTSGIRELLDEHDDEALHALMTNLGGHDLELILEAFHSAADNHPTCFIAYTLKGYQLPFQGHKDNHAGLMSSEQLTALKQRLKIRDGEEWEPFAGLDVLAEDLSGFIRKSPFAANVDRRRGSSRVPVPERLELPVSSAKISTQEGFGRLLLKIARDHTAVADRIVTTSPDVTLSTNLGSWVNRRGVYGKRAPASSFNDARSPQKWAIAPEGQHIELGIAENNLFILLAALGLSGPLFGTRLLPIGTVYDPFICRGLDALNYACYQDSRFILVATPSGLTLAPEGGAHQSISTPLIGIGQPSLTAFEPAFVDELCEILRWSFNHIQSDDGGPVYLRLSTRPLAQPARTITPELSARILEGAYWMVEPADNAEACLVASGSVVEEARQAHKAIVGDLPGTGLLVVTSADRLQRGWIKARRASKPGVDSYVERLLAAVPAKAGLVTILDGHSGGLSWLGAVRSHRVVPLGVEKFGQSGNLPDLYRAYGLDVDAIVGAVARLCVDRARARWGGDSNAG
jgi:pyruvate dehydrogenase E1 component